MHRPNRYGLKRSFMEKAKNVLLPCNKSDLVDHEKI